MTVAELYATLGFPQQTPVEIRDAAALGTALRDGGLLLMEQEGDRLARKRRAGWWSLRVLPGLIALVVVFALVSGRVSPALALAAGLLIIALRVMSRISTMGVELAAVKRAVSELEKKRGFRRLSEEKAVITCARASVWEGVFPW